MMGVEIQNEVINKMLTDTASDMRLIAAKLIPFMMMNGNTMDICKFNDFTDEIASLLEAQVSNVNKTHFASPTILEDHVETFLFNLAMCLCRSYSDMCENCPDQTTCQRANIEQSKDPHIVPISKAPEPKNPKVRDDDTDEFL